MAVVSFIVMMYFLLHDGRLISLASNFNKYILQLHFFLKNKRVLVLPKVLLSCMLTGAPRYNGYRLIIIMNKLKTHNENIQST